MLALLQNCLCLLFPLAPRTTRQHVSGCCGPCIIHPFPHPALNPSNAILDTQHFVHTLDMDLISQIPIQSFNLNVDVSNRGYFRFRLEALLLPT